MAEVVELIPDGAFVRIDAEVPPWFSVATRLQHVGWVAGELGSGRLRADESLAGGPGVAPPVIKLHGPAVLRSGPARGRTSSGVLPPGVIVRVLGQLGTWVDVGGVGGASGWIDLLEVPAS